jgi:hypothetical protein
MNNESRYYTCPVCGYDRLARPPTLYAICPSCGTEFEYHDFTLSHADLRRAWIENGPAWHSKRIAKPAGWDPWLQLMRAGLLTKDNFKSLKAVASSTVQVRGTLQVSRSLQVQSTQTSEARAFKLAANYKTVSAELRQINDSSYGGPALVGAGAQ